MTRSLIGAALLALASFGVAEAQVKAPAHNIVSEDAAEQRRAVWIRIERRLDEAELLTIAELVRQRAQRTFSRTIVYYFLPGMALNQGAWASVMFSPEPKVLVHGLRREDEDMFLAEHRADRRSILGSWLTSPPAAPGRLTIYSDHGRVYAEWRLRNGQKTVDELKDERVRGIHRFVVPDGGFYELNRTGDLEIWEKTTLIAVADRIRPEALALPTAVALGNRRPAAPVPALAAVDTRPASPVQAEARPFATSEQAIAGLTAHRLSPALLPPAAQRAPEAEIAVINPPSAADLDPEPIEPKRKPRTAKAKSRNKANTEVASKTNRGTTTGDQIRAKLAGQF